MLEARAGDQLSRLRLLVERSQQGLRLRDGEVLMATPAFGPTLGGDQAAAQIVRPHPARMADAQADGLRDGLGGEVLLGAQPQALQTLEGGGVAGRQQGPAEGPDWRGGYFSSRTQV